jgi:hypothetical protein
VVAQLGAMRDCLEGRAFDNQFGILVALPDIRVHQWTEFINSSRSTANFDAVKS